MKNKGKDSESIEFESNTSLTATNNLILDKLVEMMLR